MIHGGLLGKFDDPSHQAQMQEHGIEPIEIVCVNLYPFVETISKPNVTLKTQLKILISVVQHVTCISEKPSICYSNC